MRPSLSFVDCHFGVVSEEGKEGGREELKEGEKEGGKKEGQTDGLGYKGGNKNWKRGLKFEPSVNPNFTKRIYNSRRKRVTINWLLYFYIIGTELTLTSAKINHLANLHGVYSILGLELELYLGITLNLNKVSPINY